MKSTARTQSETEDHGLIFIVLKVTCSACSEEVQLKSSCKIFLPGCCSLVFRCSFPENENKNMCRIYCHLQTKTILTVCKTIRKKRNVKTVLVANLKEPKI